MKFSTILIAAACLFSAAMAAPIKTSRKRADHCDLWDSVQTVGYSVYILLAINQAQEVSALALTV